MPTAISQFQHIAEAITSGIGLFFVCFRASGAYKETFLVQGADKTKYALKVCDPSKINIDRSSREIEAMRRCSSPQIGKLHKHGQFEDNANSVTYIFMLEEFFDGGTLAERLASGPMKPEQVRRFGLALSEALAHMEPLSLVHRDIKPDNIMFRTSGDDIPVLVDLGLVRDLSAVSLTQTWQHMGPGTPLYASPEQLNNKKWQIGWRSDQFSLGIVLAICMTGNHPFALASGSTDYDVVSAIGSYSRCSSQFSELSIANGLGNVARMMEPLPIHRFLTPTDLHSSFKENEQ